MIPIYHLNIAPVSRSGGSGGSRSVVAKAAYRAGEKLIDESRVMRTSLEERGEGASVTAKAAYRAAEQLNDPSHGKPWDFSHKQGVVFSEISLPEAAPAWMADRQSLWNAVEAAEKRPDAQLAREFEVGLPNFFSIQQNAGLVRDYVQRELVSRGMIADWSIHADNENNLHAHILVTMRDVAPEDSLLPAKASHEIRHAAQYGFLGKNRGWNERGVFMRWREAWAELTNEHLARAGLAVRIDHRSYAEQGIRLKPGRKIGVGQSRQNESGLPSRISDRIKEQQQIAQFNGEQILADPTVALDALAYSEATFTHRDIARFLNTHTHTTEQFTAAYQRVTQSPELISLGKDNQGAKRFTTRTTVQTERDLFTRAAAIASRRSHGVSEHTQARVLERHKKLSAEQRRAFASITGPGGLAVIVGVAGAGKSTLFNAVREAWMEEGYRVRGAALAGIAAENQHQASGIQSGTIASLELAWKRGRRRLSPRDVLVLDEAGVVGTRQFARVLTEVHESGAKVVLIGDPQQIQAIEAGAAFRGIASRHGFVELQDVHRQQLEWQKTATRAFSKGRVEEALELYEARGAVVQVESREQAQTAMLAHWAHDAKIAPDYSRLMLAYTNDDAQRLNALARAMRIQQGEIGQAYEVNTDRGRKPFGVGDRLYFLSNNEELGVQNGSIGTIEGIDDGVFQVKVDGKADAIVHVDTSTYTNIDYGYAATVAKNQGSTVDLTYVLATPHYDQHAAYVAMTRHRWAAKMFYARTDFDASDPSAASAPVDRARRNLFATLGRPRPKELVHDYLELDLNMPADSPRPRSLVDRFQAGIAKGRRSASVGPAPASAAERFARAVERGRIAALEADRQKAAESARRDIALNKDKDADKDLSL